MNRSQPARAFTLIELLVVIAITALLIGILVPAVGYARRVSRTAQCMGLLRQYGAAHQLYADANRDWFAPQLIAEHRHPWVGNVAYRQLLGLGTPADAPPAEDGNIGPLSLEPLVCPAVPDKYRSMGNRVYGMNDGLSGGVSSETEYYQPISIRRSAVQRPSEKVMMVDALDWAVNWANAHTIYWDLFGEEWGDVTQGFTAYRHERRANVLHFDGSAGTYDPKRLYGDGDWTTGSRIWRVAE